MLHFKKREVGISFLINDYLFVLKREVGICALLSFQFVRGSFQTYKL